MDDGTLDAINRTIHLWHIGEVRSVSPMAGGANNHAYRIESPQGVYVLKVMADGTNAADIDAQTRLLEQVREGRPGFSVPVPLRLDDGSPFAKMEERSNRLCLLTRLIAGSHPDGSRVDEIVAVARGLATLHQVLARIPDPELFTCGPRIDALPAMIAALGGPRNLANRLGLSVDVANELVQVLTRAIAAARSVDRTPPSQLVHTDLYPSNVLIADGKVSGFLDFEFASIGQRAYDVTLAVWTVALRDVWREEGASGWEMAREFLDAYDSEAQLATGEVNLARDRLVQEGHSLVHWTRRYLAGRVSGEEIRMRVARAISIDQWVTAHEERLRWLRV